MLVSTDQIIGIMAGLGAGLVLLAVYWRDAI